MESVTDRRQDGKPARLPRRENRAGFRNRVGLIKRARTKRDDNWSEKRNELSVPVFGTIQVLSAC